MIKKSKFDTDFSSVEDMEDLFEQYSNPLRNHSRRVAICVSTMAEYAQEFTYIHDLPHGTSFLITMHLGGMCHDIGKLIIPASTHSYADNKNHPEAGAALLEENREALFDNVEQAEIVLDIVRYHHERPDGRGFPYRLREREIPFPAGICSIANWLDNKIFKESNPNKDLVKIFDNVSKLAGQAFCKSAVMCFERAKLRLIEQYDNWSQSII